MRTCIHCGCTDDTATNLRRAAECEPATTHIERNKS